VSSLNLPSNCRRLPSVAGASAGDAGLALQALEPGCLGKGADRKPRCRATQFARGKSRWPREMPRPLRTPVRSS